MKLVLKVKEEGIQSAPGGPKVDQGHYGGAGFMTRNTAGLEEIGLVAEDIVNPGVILLWSI